MNCITWTLSHIKKLRRDRVKCHTALKFLKNRPSESGCVTDVRIMFVTVL